MYCFPFDKTCHHDIFLYYFSNLGFGTRLSCIQYKVLNWQYITQCNNLIFCQCFLLHLHLLYLKCLHYVLPAFSEKFCAMI